MTDKRTICPYCEKDHGPGSLPRETEATDKVQVYCMGCLEPRIEKVDKSKHSPEYAKWVQSFTKGT